MITLVSTCVGLEHTFLPQPTLLVDLASGFRDVEPPLQEAARCSVRESDIAWANQRPGTVRVARTSQDSELGLGPRARNRPARAVEQHYEEYYLGDHHLQRGPDHGAHLPVHRDFRGQGGRVSLQTLGLLR